jgi:hypothetical protein
MGAPQQKRQKFVIRTAKPSHQFDLKHKNISVKKPTFCRQIQSPILTF